MILAHHVGPSGQVVAVEALPHNARLAAVNRDLNGFAQVHVEAAAVADRPGELEIAMDLDAHVKHAATDIGTVRVPAVTVDELAEWHGPPDVLFIDVEGYECHALRGAARTLERRPDCYVEVHGGCGLEQAGGSVGQIFGGSRSRTMRSRHGRRPNRRRPPSRGRRTARRGGSSSSRGGGAAEGD